MPAAKSAPNAISRMTRVTGNDRRPALARSLSNWPSTSRAELPSPNSATVSSGCDFWTAATASSTGFEIVFALSAELLNSKFTSAE
jgi:hypothetical protein